MAIQSRCVWLRNEQSQNNNKIEFQSNHVSTMEFRYLTFTMNIVSLLFFDVFLGQLLSYGTNTPSQRQNLNISWEYRSVLDWIGFIYMLAIASVEISIICLRKTICMHHIKWTRIDLRRHSCHSHSLYPKTQHRQQFMLCCYFYAYVTSYLLCLRFRPYSTHIITKKTF